MSVARATEGAASRFQPTFAAEQVEALADAREPLLIGVRHHSAALSRALPASLDEFAPAAVLVELPDDMADWIDYLADERTVAPIALSAAGADGELFFYPFADFSPELVAIRWATRRGIPVVPIDLPTSARAKANVDLGALLYSEEADDDEPAAPGLLDAMLRRTDSSDTGQLWERLVESPGVGASPEAVRRAALAFGLAIRNSSRQVIPRDLVREVAMRRAIRSAPPHSVAVIGSFHAAALSPDSLNDEASRDEEIWAAVERSGDAPAISLVPYDFDQLDERSGYPAGVRDPAWRQMVVEAASPSVVDQRSVALAVQICRELRAAGHVAGTPDASEIVRVMRALAGMRGLAVAGRGELLEAIQSCLVQGELHGRARSVARAAERVLIGDRRGAVSPATPKCGLSVDLEKLLKELNLPGPESQGDDAKEVRLDVLRSPRDRARAVTLRRLNAAGISYAERIDTVEQGARENLAERWKIQWRAATGAQVAAASRRGVTLEQAVEAIARGPAKGSSGDEGPNPSEILNRMQIAAECGLGGLLDAALLQIDAEFRNSADVATLVAAAVWIGRVAAGHVVGLPAEEAEAYPPLVRPYRLPGGAPRIEGLLDAALDRLEGLEGSDRREDVAGLAELTYWFTGDLALPGSSSSEPDRLASWCRRTLDRGSDRMRGAAAGTLAALGRMEPSKFSALTAGWFDGGTTPEGRRRLRFGLAGAADVLLSSAQADGVWLDGLDGRFRRTTDAEFLERLPALRGGFSELAPADRRRLLEARLNDYDDRGSALGRRMGADFAGAAVAGGVDLDPTARFARYRGSDIAGRAAVEALFPDFFAYGSALLEPKPTPAASTSSEPDGDPPAAETEGLRDAAPPALPAGSISPPDRWRLTFAVDEVSAPRAVAAARALDQLYGRGKGEGARAALGRGRGPNARGGTEAPEPTSLEWAEDLEDLFGSDVCQEVLGSAAEGGDSAAIEALDPDQVQPSVELLRQVLSLAGGLPESRSEKLRRLARRITQQLAQQLAERLRPALSGLSTARPSRRRSRRLHLARTIAENLKHAQRRDGRNRIIAERLIFRTPVQREMDWHLTFVVDVSGSMSASVVYSALVAAIFAELPALSVRFLAFSTEVIDLTHHCDDPLSLLLEVQVGGGTYIGLGLRAARGGIKTPTRSLVVLVSDFEEGVSIGELIAEVRALVGAGVKCVGLAALDDSGTARFHQGYAQMVAAAGMPVAAVSPENLARWVGDRIRGVGSDERL
ncbi:MAG TPA: DUF5682 family protein [Pirellulaceae bacterium]|nr:DUF5682 family protein [Pirellulaceae bacterium]